MNNKKSIFSPIRLTVGLIFLMVLMLNIQTNNSGGWDLVNTSYAKEDAGGWLWESVQTTEPCTREICWIPGIMCDTFSGTRVRCYDGWSVCIGYCDA